MKQPATATHRDGILSAGALGALGALLTFALALAPVAARDHDHDHAHSHGDASTLTLNEGQKWIADSHTYEAAQTMMDLVDAVPAKASAKTLRALGEDLNEELQGLIRGCTMTGPAHDQLHTWIEGLSPDLQSLMKAQDVTQGKAALENVSRHLEAFETHFEEEQAP